MQIACIVLFALLIAMLIAEISATYTRKKRELVLRTNIYRVSLILLAQWGVIVLWVMTKN